MNSIDVTLACKNANSKLVEVVTVAVGLRGLGECRGLRGFRGLRGLEGLEVA